MKTLEFDYYNVGGLLHVYAIPPTSLRRIRKDYVGGLNYIELQQRDDVIEIPVLPDSSYSFSEDKEFADGGDSWNIAVSGIIPKMQTGNSDMMELLDRGEWYVLAVDQNGEAHLCGTETCLMRFDRNGTTGGTYAERNGISFTFTCRQESPSVYIALD